MRQQTTTPIAMGELFNNTQEWLSLVTERLIDFIRLHLSQVGGITFARKVAALCEFFAVNKNPNYTVHSRQRRSIVCQFACSVSVSQAIKSRQFL
jgi:L-alanine-DL-glutamate epimerase-like enolase superfamily enzyme